MGGPQHCVTALLIPPLTTHRLSQRRIMYLPSGDVVVVVVVAAGVSIATSALRTMHRRTYKEAIDYSSR